MGATSHTGSYITRQAITLTTAFGAQVNGRYAPGYDQPARLADLQGRYAGDALGSLGPVIEMALSVASDGATANGIAHVSTAKGELFVLAMNAAKTDGWMYLGSRTTE